MEKKAPTWYGFTLTQKQAVTIFVLALFGVLICTFVYIMFFSSMYMYYSYSIDPSYDYMDDNLNIQIISGLPILIFFFVIFIICCYSLSMSKQTAKYYNRMKNYPPPQTQSQPQHRIYTPTAPQRIIPETRPTFNERMFCPNCGTKHDESHQFCINCGFELV